MSAKCKSCGAIIRWVVMPGGKKMPVDNEPHPEGNVFIHSDGIQAAVLTQEELKAAFRNVQMGAVNENRHRSHFATCPFASTHRKNEENQ